MAEARAQLHKKTGCLEIRTKASEIATATARKLLVERRSLQGRLSQVTHERADLKQQLQQEAAKRAAAEQQVAELKQQVERLQAEVGNVGRTLLPETAELVTGKGTEVTAPQGEMTELGVGGLTAHLVQCRHAGKMSQKNTRPLLCRSYSRCCIPGTLCEHQPCPAPAQGAALPVHPGILLLPHVLIYSGQ